MTPPCRGLLRGTTSAKRVSSSRAFSRIFSMSGPPPTVWLATTRIVLISLPRRLRARGPRGGGHPLAGFAEHPVDRARDPVLVWAADHGGDRVEVEDGRGRGDLPFQRERPPRVGLGSRPAAPAGDHVVEEDQGAGAHHERRQ